MRVERLSNLLRGRRGHGSELSASSPHIIPTLRTRGGQKWRTQLTPDWLNGGQGLHGAAAAWLLDMFTGTSLHRLGTDNWSPWGPSINFEINFYNPAPAGTVLRCETIIDRAGGAVSTVLCLMSDKKTGRRILTGVHTTQRPKGGAFGKVGAKFNMKAAQTATAKL